MRAGVIVAFVLVAATPTDASKSCMTMAEARAQFATSYLYWHGVNHCWDATPPRHRLGHRVKPQEDQQARRGDREASSQEPKWRNAMSEMLARDAPIGESSAPTSLAADEPPRIDWLDRWVDVAQVASPAIFSRMDDPADTPPTAGRKADSTITPASLILMFLGFVVTLTVILFRNAIHEWQSNGTA
jgi:hypothetical protein